MMRLTVSPHAFTPSAPSNSALQNFSVKADVGKVIDIREGELDRETLDKRLGV